MNIQSIELSNAASILLYVCMVLFSTLSMSFAHRSDRCQRKTDTRFWLLLTIIIISIPGVFRYYVGIDYANYFQVGERLRSFGNLERAMSYWGRLEGSYGFIVYYFDKVGLGSAAVIGFYCLLTQILMVFGIWNLRDKINPTAQMFVYMTYFYFRTYNMARQALSVAIILWGLKYIIDKKYIKFAITVVMATLFHRTAIIGIMMIWYFRPVKKKSRIFNFVICYVVPFAFVLMFEYLMNLVSRIPVFSVYVTDTLKYTTYNNESFFSLGTLLLIIEVVLYILHRNSYINDENEEFYIGILDKAMFCQVLSFILSMTAGNAARIILYYSFLSMLSLSNMINTKRYQEEGVSFSFRSVSYYQIFVIVYSVAMFIRTMANNGFGQLPYRFWY